MTTDFHSHILPHFDDGAKDTAMSLEMLKKSKAMGVDTVVSTSHCYPYSQGDVEDFLSGRKEAYARLVEAMQNSGEALPDIRLGCEVHLTRDLTRFDGLERLCVEGTDYMLVEMPMSKWTDRTIDRLYKLSISGIKPIIAHAERNLMQDKELLDTLYTLDVLIQINAESFGIAQLRRFIDGMVKSKMVHIVGSDMHNTTSRPPEMDKARKNITRRFGAECWEYLMSNAQTILDGNELSYRALKSFKKKLFF